MQTLNIDAAVPVLGSEIRIQIRPNGGYHIVINCNGSAKLRAADTGGSSVLSAAGGEITLNNSSYTNTYFHLICIATGATSVDVEWHLVYMTTATARFGVTVT
jgi:hypothetical protein